MASQCAGAVLLSALAEQVQTGLPDVTESYKAALASLPQDKGPSCNQLLFWRLSLLPKGLWLLGGTCAYVVALVWQWHS